MNALESSRRILLVVVGLVVCLEANDRLGTVAAEGVGGQSIAERKDSLRVPAKEPDEALKTFELVGGFRMDLLAAEPLITEPIVLAYDENGLLYVAEYLNFPHPLRKDLPPIGQIRVLRDADGDGKFDRSHIFADQLTWPAGIAPWKGGVFVAAAPDIWYFKDVDGDHRADIREKVFTGFGFLDNDEAIVNNLIWGLDHKIYGSTGRSGGAVRPAERPEFEEISVRGRDFRFDPLTGIFEPISGTEQFGNTFDDYGNRFLCSNSRPAVHEVLPARYLARNPYLPVSDVLRPTWKDTRVFRASSPEPWRIARTQLRVSTPKNWSAPSVRHDVFTAATGVTIYRGAAYPEEYRGNLFVGDVQGNLVHRRLLKPVGVTFDSERADPDTEFVRSTDNWFRPVNFVNAPDGTLHLVDMYREVIETPRSLPEEIKARLDLSSGHERGRIYRLTPPGFEAPPPPRLGSASTHELVMHLQNPNGWWRDTAHRLLYERQDSAAAEPLRKLLAEGPLPQSRLHALWSLEGLGVLGDEDILYALADASDPVREHAVRLAESRLDRNPAILEKVLALTGDPNPRVRLQVAFSLGEVALDARAAVGLSEIARKDAEDLWIRTAVLSSALPWATHLFERLLGNPEFLSNATNVELLGELALVIGAQNDPNVIDLVLGLVEESPTIWSNIDLRRSLVLGLGDGLRRSRASLSRYLLDSSSPSARMLLDLSNDALITAQNRSAKPQVRRQAVQLLGHGSFPRVKEVLAAVLQAREPPAVQMAALRALSGFEDPEVATILLGAWRHCTPTIRSEVIEVLLSRRAWIEPLLDAIETENFSASPIGPVRRALLMKHPDARIRSRTKTLFGRATPRPRSELIAHFQASLSLEGDEQQGQKIFRRECMACHPHGNQDHAVGPNLMTIQNRAPEAILVQILDPSREVLPNYVQYIVSLDDGRVVTGIIAAESQTSITLQRAQNARQIILRQNIEEMVSTGKSLMPEDLAKKIDLQQMADLLKFLASLHQ